MLDTSFDQVIKRVWRPYDIVVECKNIDMQMVFVAYSSQVEKDIDMLLANDKLWRGDLVNGRMLSLRYNGGGNYILGRYWQNRQVLTKLSISPTLRVSTSRL